MNTYLFQYLEIQMLCMNVILSLRTINKFFSQKKETIYFRKIPNPKKKKNFMTNI